MKRATAVLVTLALVSGGVGQAKADPVVLNAGFESPDLNGGYQRAPNGADWTFTSFSGEAANDSLFGVSNATGNQAAFVQGDGYMLQDISGFSQTTYTLHFLAEGRPANAGSNPLAITLDASPILFGGAITITPPSGFAFVSYTSDPFTVTAGIHTLTFQGLNVDQSAGNDKSSFIDEVGFLLAVPEPSSLILLGAATGWLLGYALPRQRK
jgi:hypothetical protein